MFLNLSSSIKHSISIRKCFRIGQTKSSFYRHEILLSKSWLFFHYTAQVCSISNLFGLTQFHAKYVNLDNWFGLSIRYTILIETFDIMNNWTLLHYIRKLFLFFQFMWLENLVYFCSNWEISVKLEFANFFIW